MVPPPAKRARSDDGGALSSAEATQYDRQIRLWGVDAQKRLRSSRILVIGSSGLSAELCKNIVLAGVGKLTLLDDAAVTAADLASNFFLSEADVGQVRAERMVPPLRVLNPNVGIAADVSRWQDKPDAFFGDAGEDGDNGDGGFDFVVACDLSLHEMARVNAACRAGGSSFFGTAVDGLVGFTFADLGEHEFVEEVKKPQAGGKEPETVQEKRSVSFCPMQSALDQSWSGQRLSKHQTRLFFRYLVASEFKKRHGRGPAGDDVNAALLSEARTAALEAVGADVALVSEEQLEEMRRATCQLGPVCAIVGGMLAAEAIKAISKKDSPYDNFMFYDGAATVGQVMHIG